MTEEVLPVIRLSVRFSRLLSKVWSSFTDPILMLQWLGNEISADIKHGGSIRFLGENAPTTSELGDTWTIKQLNEEKAILFSWTVLGVDTLFVVTFKQSGSGSIMEIKHGAVPISAKDYHLSEHWNLLLANFKSALELNEPALRFDYSKYKPLRTTRYDPLEVRLSVLIHAPPSLPFDVWTNPEKLKHFLRIEEPKVDRQYAGIYTWWAEGWGPVLFTKMEQDRELEFSWVYGIEPETRVNIRFEEVDDDTLVSLHHHGFKNPEAVTGYDIGWASILAELKLVCELGESGIDRISDWGVQDTFYL